MIQETKNGRFTISECGLGEGFYEVSREDLENLALDIENVVINNDKGYAEYVFKMMNDVASTYREGLIQGIKKGVNHG